MENKLDNIEFVVKHWLESSEEDFLTMQNLYNS
jgi:hypothetical protein